MDAVSPSKNKQTPHIFSVSFPLVSQTQWLKATKIYYLIVLQRVVPNQFHWVSSKGVSSSFRSLQGKTCFLVFSHVYNLSATLGSWLLPPSSKPAMQHILYSLTSASILISCLSQSDSPDFLLEGPLQYLGPLQTIQDNSISRSLITSAKSQRKQIHMFQGLEYNTFAGPLFGLPYFPMSLKNHGLNSGKMGPVFFKGMYRS